MFIVLFLLLPLAIFSIAPLELFARAGEDSVIPLSINTRGALISFTSTDSGKESLILLSEGWVSLIWTLISSRR